MQRGLLIGCVLLLLLTAFSAARASAQAPTDSGGTRQRRVVVPYEEGMTIPPGRSYLRVHDRRLQRLSGALLFATTYVSSAVGRTVVLARRDRLHFRALVPVVGSVWSAYHDRRRRVAGIFGTLVQTAGLVTLLLGMTGSDRDLVYYTARGRGLRGDITLLPGGAGLTLGVF